MAKNDVAYREAALQFQNREVEKVYHALVKGRFPEEALKVDVPLRTTSSGKVKPDSRKGKDAVTIFRPKEYFKQYTLVEAKPITGRTHQIRVHLAYIDFPICGDTTYGGDPIYLSEFKKGYKQKNEADERPIFDRVALHAFSLSIKNIEQNLILENCEYPKDISMILRKLKKFN
jgi:23S rRNA pseudouridine955/2504/2580 synthase